VGGDSVVLAFGVMYTTCRFRHVLLRGLPELVFAPCAQGITGKPPTVKQGASGMAGRFRPSVGLTSL
jgi:hypothetical protein